MGGFFKNNPTVIIALIGLLLAVLNFVNLIQNRKRDHFVSGIPLFGGLLILIGFLLSHHKWLALLCFTDYSWLMFPYAIISEHLPQKKKEENKDDDNLQR